MRLFTHRRYASLLVGFSLMATAASIAACRDITSLAQENPGALSGSTLFVPGNAQLIVNGAISDFECAYARYVVGSGLFTDELSVGISASANFDYDARRFPTNGPYGTNNCAAAPSATQQPGIYTPLSTARATADTAAAYLEVWTDAIVANRTKLLGQAYVYAGYSLILLGEGMCSAAINLGPEIQSAELFTQAKIRFDKAITAATTANDAATLNLARVGRARALLDLGGAANRAAAAVDAALVPATFVANTSPDAVNARRQNALFIAISQSSFSTVDTAFRNVLVPGGTTQDPRVAVTDLARNGTATGSRIFLPAKAPTNATAMRVASYAEAQLIIAENAAATGDLAAAVTAINNARARTAGVPAYVLPAGATAASVQTQIIEERRREFFVEGHRLGDLRRYSLPFTPASGAAYQYGGVYGTLTCFPLPDVERINNPTIAKGS
ncbi:MAG: RagB/SusD protein [Gemmatimonadetes bacterium]|nr:RagB/SusD protein [Gemmatimonadota bacterium]